MTLGEDLAALGLQLAANEQYEKDESGCGVFPPSAVVQARPRSPTWSRSQPPNRMTARSWSPTRAAPAAD